MKNIFLKQVLFTPLDRIRFTRGLVAQLKNNTQQRSVYTLKSASLFPSSISISHSICYLLFIFFKPNFGETLNKTLLRYSKL